MPSIDNKKKSQKNKILYIFLTVFFITLVMAIYIAIAFTPNIDIDIQSSPEETIEMVKKNIDDRLKDIQEEDLYDIPKNKDTESSSEIIEQLQKLKEEAIAKQQRKDEIELETEITDDEISENKQTKTEPTTPKISLATPTYTRQVKPTQPQKSAKVYVGKFTNFEDALSLQNELIVSGLASAPFIKNINGYYVVQIGSYLNHQTAQNIAENIIENGYSARIILE